jgi:hypothetical protein
VAPNIVLKGQIYSQLLFSLIVYVLVSELHVKIGTEVLLPVGEELGEVLLVVGHAGLLREEEDQQQLQERQVADPLAVHTK